MYKIIINSLIKIFNIEKNFLFSIFLLTFLGALTQTINIILVGPLALTFFNPDLILQTEIIAQLNKYNLNISKNNIFILICVAFLITFILSNLISLLKNTLQIYLTQKVKFLQVVVC